MFVDTHCHLYKEYYDDIEKKIDLKKSQILQIINKLREYNLVLKTGQGVNTKYMIK